MQTCSLQRFPDQVPGRRTLDWGEPMTWRVNDDYLIYLRLVLATQSANLNVLGLLGLVELLNRAQCCSADDQRGLLKKEHLMLPQFLQLPLEEEEEAETNRSLEESCSSMGSLEVDSPAVRSETLGKEQSANECSNSARETVVWAKRTCYIFCFNDLSHWSITNRE